MSFQHDDVRTLVALLRANVADLGDLVERTRKPRGEEWWRLAGGRCFAGKLARVHGGPPIVAVAGELLEELIRSALLEAGVPEEQLSDMRERPKYGGAIKEVGEKIKTALDAKASTPILVCMGRIFERMYTNQGID